MSKHALWCLRFLVYLAVLNMTLGELCAQVPPPAAPAEPPAPRGENGSLEIPLLKAHLSEKLDARKQPADATNQFPATAAWVHLLVQLKQDSPDGMVMITMYRAGKVEDKRLVEAKAGTRFVVSFFPLRADTFPVGSWWVTFKAGGEVLGSIPFTVGDAAPPTPTAPATPTTPTAPTTTPGAPPTPGDQPPAPGPAPTGLEPLPQGEPQPQSLPACPLKPQPAGTRLAQMMVGPKGGTVEASGQLTLAFPEDALTEEETIAVAAGPLADDALLFEITRSGQGAMARAVQVTLQLPTGVAPAEVVPIHQVAEAVYHVPAYQYDAATRTLRLEVNHFSKIGIVLTVALVAGDYATSKRDDEFVRRAGSTLGQAIVLDYLVTKGITAVFTVPGLGYVVVGAVAGAYLATKVAERYYKMGLTGALPVGKFRFYWPSGQGGAAAWLAVHRKSRMMLAFRGPDDFSPAQKTGEPLAFPGVNGTFPYADIDFIRLPESILGVIAEFQYADAWYTLNQMALPAGPTDVLVRQMDNVGEVSLGMIHLRAGLLAGEASTGFAMSAAVAHEMFHLICRDRGWVERRFVGSEDSVCVAMETLVFPYTKAFSEFQWAGTFRRLCNGLTRQGPGEGEDTTPAQRGYYFWPWTRFLAHWYGVSSVRDYAMGTVPDEVALAGRFRNFCYSIIATDREIGDYVHKTMLDGRRVRAMTGWGLDGRTLDSAAAATMGDARGRIPLGTYDLPPSRPLSFRVVPIEVPRFPRGVVVVRRERPEPTEEFVALKPAPASQVGPALPSGHTTRDMVSMVGGVAVRGPWVDSDAFKEALPVALICTATTPESAPQGGNRLLAYRLNPPAEIKMDKQPPKPTRLTWSPPDFGCELKQSNCLSSYRVFGKTRDNRDELIAELYFDIPQDALRPLPGKLMLALKGDQSQLELPASLTERYVALGMQSVEKELRYMDGRPVMSGIAWSDLVCTIAISPNPFEATVGRPLEFDAKADFPPPGATYKWDSTGQVNRNGSPTAPVQFAAEGPASVTVTLFDTGGRRLCSATASGLVKKKEERQPTTGVWRLVERKVWDDTKGEESHHKFDIGATKADCRNMHLGENRIIYQCLHSWTAPPTTLVPGKEIALTLTAQSVVWPGDEGGNRTGTSVSWGGREDNVVSPMGTNETASKEFRMQLPKEGGGGYSICISGAGGWMHWSVTYVYEWVPAQP